jgi:hypothetical protein
VLPSRSAASESIASMRPSAATGASSINLSSEAAAHNAGRFPDLYDFIADT